jgi:threonine/homoserine/homoserine lactone efflux protein
MLLANSKIKPEKLLDSSYGSKSIFRDVFLVNSLNPKGIIIVIPGPTNIYIVGQSLNHGKKASVPLSVGVISGDALSISLSLLGVSALLSLFSTAFTVMKYCGSA